VIDEAGTLTTYRNSEIQKWEQMKHEERSDTTLGNIQKRSDKHKTKDHELK